MSAIKVQWHTGCHQTPTLPHFPPLCSTGRDWILISFSQRFSNLNPENWLKHIQNFLNETRKLAFATRVQVLLLTYRTSGLGTKQSHSPDGTRSGEGHSLSRELIGTSRSSSSSPRCEMLNNTLGGGSGKQKCPNSYSKAPISHPVLPLSKMLSLGKELL